MTKKFLRWSFPDSIERSLRAKVTLGVIIPMVLMLCIFMFFEYTHHRTVLLNNLSVLASYNGGLVEETLQTSMKVSDFTEVQRILDTVGKDQNFRIVYLLDTSGHVMFAPNAAGTGLRLDNHDPTCQPCHKLPPNQRPSGIVVAESNGERVFRSMHPIENGPACAQCHDPQQRLIGVLLTDIAVAPFEAAFVADLRENLIFGVGIILICAIIAYSVMGSLVIRRLKRVADALTGFGSGQRNLRLISGSRDEIGQIEVDFNEMTQQIQTEELENQALSADLRHHATQQQELLKRLITVQEDERKRLARELHDELGQSLSGLALHSEVMGKFMLSDPERALEQLSLTRELIQNTTQQMYELILDLRPSVLDDLGIAAALRTQAERLFKGSRIAFNLDSSGLAKRLPPSIETTLYRIFQEALSNIVRHSGADQVEIRLATRDGYFEGEIADNGHGFNSEIIEQEGISPHGLGLLGMQERVSLCGGSMNITSRKGEGTQIHVRIPLIEADYE